MGSFPETYNDPNNGPSFLVLFRAMYSGSRPPDSPASPGTSSTSSVSGSSQTLLETPRAYGAGAFTYGASYTVTSVTPNGERSQGAAKSVGVTVKAHTASGTLYAIASGPSSPPQSPRSPDKPIFGSTSQRHRKTVVNGEGNSRVDVGTMDSRFPEDSYGAVRVNIEAMPDNSSKRDSGHETTPYVAQKNDAMPFKETSLGAVITTVNTYKQKPSYEDITEASMSDTVDQIEKAFGFRTPDMIANGTGSLERNGSLRMKVGDRASSGSLQDIQLTPRRAQSGETLNQFRGGEGEDSQGNILKRLTREADREQSRVLQRKSEGDLPQNVMQGRNTTTTVVEASPTSVEVKKEMRRKSEYEARLAARNLLIERLENHRQSLEGPSDKVEGIKIYHAKSRSTPVDWRNVSENKQTNSRLTTQDDSAKMPAERVQDDDVKTPHHLRRKKSGEQSPSKVRTPDTNRTSVKPVVRSERKIRLTSSANPGHHLPADKSHTVPRQRSSRRRHSSKQSSVTAAGGNSDSTDEETRERNADAVDASQMIAGKLLFSPESHKKSSSLPREWDARTTPHATIPRESRGHRSHSQSHSHLKNARITKIKMSASEEPSDSIVDQTSRLLHAAKAVKYDKGSSLVVAEDVLHSLTRASDLLHHQSSVAREEREKEKRDKDKSLSRIKAPGKISLSCWPASFKSDISVMTCKT